MVNGTEENKDLQRIVNLDSAIHNPVRLAILIFLLQRGKTPFTMIQKVLDVTSGNLNSHLKKLNSENLIVVTKTFINAKPTTLVEITDTGREKVNDYASNLTNVLKKML